jgi:SAM-dependent methyltransferase
VNPLSLSKPPSYYGHVRQDVVDCIKASGITARNAVELGCSDGSTGAAIIDLLHPATYGGLELDKESAQRAQSKLNWVLWEDISKFDPIKRGFYDMESYDLLIALDVLEHLYDPWDVLKRWVDVLIPGGHVVLSIPNIGHISVLLSLANGHWNYTAEGLLDATHIRFFTWENIKEMLDGLGLTVVRLQPVLTQKIEMGKLAEKGNKVTAGNITVEGLTNMQVVGLSTFQWLVVARKDLHTKVQVGALPVPETVAA